MFIKTDITEAITNTAAIVTSESLNESDLPAAIRVILSLGAGVIIGVKGSKYIIKSGKTGEILGEIAGGASIKEGTYGVIEDAIKTSNIDEIETIIRSFDLKDLSSEEIENLIKAANKSNLSSDDIKKIEKLLRNEGISKVIESGTSSVIYGSEDIGKYKYNMMENPGPLAELPNQPQKNFFGGRYNAIVLQEDTIMYRAGNSKNPYGRWFTSKPPASVANVRIDTAVKAHWINPKTGMHEASSYIDKVYAIKVPKGTTVYIGPVGPQGGAYVGGYDIMQTYIDVPWSFEVVDEWSLR